MGIILQYRKGVGGFTNIAPQPDQNLESGDIASQPQKPFIERQKTLIK